MAKRKPAKPKKGTPFTPFVQPTRPPAGLYDPSIDAQEAAATRGLEDLRADTGVANTRAQDDFYLTQQDAARGREGIERGYGRNLADLLTARRRGEEDYSTATSNLQRQYKIQGSNQTQAGNQAGLTGGGFAAQAARKRAENQGLDQSVLDRNISRFREDSTQSEQRLGEDKSLALSDNDTALARATLGYERGNIDRTNALSRAERENTFFGADLNTQRFYQAQGAGYEMPTKPKNEGSRDVGGGHRVVYQTGKGGRVTLPNGQVISRAALRKKIDRMRAQYGSGA